MELQITGIENGVVIDHIPTEKVFSIVELLNLRSYEDVITVGVNMSSKNQGKKGLIKIANKILCERELGEIALLAPNVTINIIENFKVKEKVNLKVSDEIIGLIECNNNKCISNKEHIDSRYLKVGDKFKCFYCERKVGKDEICLKAL